MRSAKSRWVPVALAAAALAGADAFFVLGALGLARTVDEPGARGRAAIVFYAGSRDASAPRVEEAVALAETGGVDTILMVGGARPVIGFNGAEQMKSRAQRLGAPSVLAGSWSYSSETNLQEAADMLERGQIRGPVLLVSDCLHLVRLKALARVHLANWPTHYRCSPYGGGPGHVWIRAHYEALAWLAWALPDSLVEPMLRALRRQPD